MTDRLGPTPAPIVEEPTPAPREPTEKERARLKAAHDAAREADESTDEGRAVIQHFKEALEAHPAAAGLTAERPSPRRRDR